ncbi:hypothetical protein TrCOL_g1033 [Triparma columacea]|uniref:Uncharacterized protein n=1 Tax=Triparma columacea TaxID=722753 RepID=A0A9W7FZN4_9STRA|nr:hypothetical protein TrCOL_g1033 [Triparma columacea]
MFKKRKLNKSSKSFRATTITTTNTSTNTNTNNDTNDTAEDSVLSTLKSTSYRRKVLSKTSKGVSSTSLLKSSSSLNPSLNQGLGTGDDDMIMNRSLGERLKDNFGGGGGETENNVMEMKHDKAMREYIMQGMIGRGMESEALAMASEVGVGGDVGGGSDILGAQSSMRSKKDVFADLKGDLYTRSNDQGRGDGDDLAPGGAILGGTGIAEVILPKKVREKNVEDTRATIIEKERKRKERKERKEENGVGVGVGGGGGEGGGPGGSYNSNFKKHRQDWYENDVVRNRDSGKSTSASGDNTSKEDRADDGRKGFRRGEGGEGEGRRERKIDRDSQFVRQFMNRTKESRYKK